MLPILAMLDGDIYVDVKIKSRVIFTLPWCFWLEIKGHAAA